MAPVGGYGKLVGFCSLSLLLCPVAAPRFKSMTCVSLSIPYHTLEVAPILTPSPPPPPQIPFFSYYIVDIPISEAVVSPFFFFRPSTFDDNAPWVSSFGLALGAPPGRNVRRRWHVLDHHHVGNIFVAAAAAQASVFCLLLLVGNVYYVASASSPCMVDSQLLLIVCAKKQHCPPLRHCPWAQSGANRGLLCSCRARLREEPAQGGRVDGLAVAPRGLFAVLLVSAPRYVGFCDATVSRQVLAWGSFVQCGMRILVMMGRRSGGRLARKAR